MNKQLYDIAMKTSTDVEYRDDIPWNDPRQEAQYFFFSQSALEKFVDTVLVEYKQEIERLRALYKTQVDTHVEHIKGLISQHNQEREILVSVAEKFKKELDKYHET
jgi:hypothetical protein